MTPFILSDDENEKKIEMEFRVIWMGCVDNRVKAPYAKTRTIELKCVHYCTLWRSSLEVVEKELEEYY